MLPAPPSDSTPVRVPPSLSRLLAAPISPSLSQTVPPRPLPAVISATALRHCHSEPPRACTTAASCFCSPPGQRYFIPFAVLLPLHNQTTRPPSPANSPSLSSLLDPSCASALSQSPARPTKRSRAFSADYLPLPSPPPASRQNPDTPADLSL